MLKFFRDKKRNKFINLIDFQNSGNFSITEFSSVVKSMTSRKNTIRKSGHAGLSKSGISAKIIASWCTLYGSGVVVQDERYCRELR